MSESSLDLQREVEALFRLKMEEFLKWSVDNWTIKDKDREHMDRDDAASGRPPMTDEYVKGFNAGVEGVSDAFRSWMADDFN